MGTILPQLLCNRWIHSHEEDTAGELVFRPDGFAFPRSRGRAGFELRADQSLIETGIARTDGPQTSFGKWRLGADDELIFYNDSPEIPARIQRIVSAETDRLVIRKT
jgi:hypothetical protein